ncbi:MAG: DnaJ domain-containing protein [Candidatus Micrarchaeia archaeon]
MPISLKFGGLRRSLLKRRLSNIYTKGKKVNDDFSKLSKFRALEYAKYFAALGISPTSDKKKIKQAYRDIVKKYHPDVSKNASASSITMLANEAYRFLEEGPERNELQNESDAEILNMLAKNYNKLLERDYAALRNALSSGAVERWYYEQEVERFLAYKPRVEEAYKITFSGILKLRHRAIALIDQSKALLRSAIDPEEKERVEGMLDSLLYIKNSLDIVYNSARAALKDAHKIAEAQSSELRSRFSH